jgi:hypothetical protein
MNRTWGATGRSGRIAPDPPGFSAALRSIRQNESHLEDHLVSGHFAIVDGHFLVLYPSAFDILQRLVGAFDALEDRVLKTHLADAADFGDACDGHDVVLDVGDPALESDVQSARLVPLKQSAGFAARVRDSSRSFPDRYLARRFYDWSIADSRARPTRQFDFAQKGQATE